MKKTKRIINTLLIVVTVLFLFQIVQCNTINAQDDTINEQNTTITDLNQKITELNDTNWCIATTPWGHISINDSVSEQNIHEADSLSKFFVNYDTIQNRTNLFWNDSTRIGTTPMNLIIQANNGSYVEIPIGAGITW